MSAFLAERTNQATSEEEEKDCFKKSLENDETMERLRNGINPHVTKQEIPQALNTDAETHSFL